MRTILEIYISVFVAWLSEVNNFSFFMYLLKNQEQIIVIFKIMSLILFRDYLCRILMKCLAVLI